MVLLDYFLLFWMMICSSKAAPGSSTYYSSDTAITAAPGLPSTVPGLFPSIFNVASKSSIVANATCGEVGGPEVYCRLKEARGKADTQCSVCDARSPDSGKKHAVRYALEQSNLHWWQSPTLHQGPQYEHVTVTLDMKQEYQVTYVIMRAGISPRPGNWILERSSDGKVFKPWQYFAVSDDECWTQYGILASPASPLFLSDSDVICTSHFSRLKPLEGGEIHTSLVTGRPGANVSTPELSQFTRARFVRFRFQKINTPPDKFSQLVDNAYQKKLFYSIREIAVGAQCICNGHASRCKLAKGDYHCDCSHNTCGPRCDRCCPLFNALPWAPGTLTTGSPCQKCQCYGHAAACKYDPVVHAANLSLDTQGSYTGGGVCINCTSHTTGVNCENCELGYYRPTGTPPDAEVPCIACECNFMGTAGPCIRDDSQIHLGKFAGHCECLLGYAGKLCDRCAPGFHKFPNCEPCPCDIRGSKLFDTCATECECKDNVEGHRCDQCKEGFFGLKQENPGGCQTCYCSGVSTSCSEAKSLYRHIIDSTDFWLVSDMNANRTVVPSLDTDTNLLSIGNHEIPDTEAYYWLAPQLYAGNKIASYRQNLEFSVSWIVMRGDTSGMPTMFPDVILIGDNGLRIGSGSAQYHTRDNLTLSLPLVESRFYLIPPALQDIPSEGAELRAGPVSKEQFLGVLSGVRHVLLRARYHTDQAEASISYARLETGSSEDPSGQAELLDDVEQCTCPTGYQGLSCESCDFGYARVLPDSEHRHAVCTLCDCNKHAATCDPMSGQCSECVHNTEGVKCERCKTGFYGNAELGTSEDCTQCACPMSEASNNFSPTCEGNGTDYICTQCPQGYLGDHCESCDAGYYGNPTVLGGSCVACSCGGGPCEGSTGECLQCRGNTEGARCERCKPLFYGDPGSGDCKPCECSTSGSLGDECDSISGQCHCKENRAGRNCEQCAPGLGNLALDCPACDCDPVGTLSLAQPCDPVSGACYCQAGVTGVRCDQCEGGHWNFTMNGCTSCNCNRDGSLDSLCDAATGQCSCKSNMTGLSCEQCLQGHWGLQELSCAPCECNPVGAVNNSCDQITGQCVCRKGITGRTCDRCRPNYFGFSNNGCTECASCEESGMVCSEESGQCVCPPLTRGDLCNQCAPNSYGYTPRLGCQLCRCDLKGSMRAQCNNVTGDCHCRPGYTGSLCNQCEPGYYGYPKCKHCDCNQGGSISGLCDSDGQCPCKRNVQGRQCDACKEGTFSLTHDNPDGCTPCFCFHRASECSEAGVTWSQVRLSHPRALLINYDNSSSEPLYPVNTHEICYVYLALPDGNVMKDQHKTKLNVTNNLRIIPGDTVDVEIGVNFMYFDTPIYWSLPRQFLGDKIMSYGGSLRFTTETEGGTTLLPRGVLSSYPVVQIQGNDKLVLEYYPIVESQDNRHEVRFHESLWRMKNNPTDPVSRQTLMLTLQNLQHVFIRATESVDFTRATLKETSLECGRILPPQNMTLLRQSAVPGVELCACPGPYSASSCQNPSQGFFRHRSHYSAHSTSTSTSTLVLQLLGEARPCQCNNRSGACHPETGHCLDCRDNTGGPRCEACAEGYYGAPPPESSCRPCPCPSAHQNFARACLVSAGHETQCFCKPGYTGPLCDRCAYGYFGFPSQPSGSCAPCNCSPYGSVSDECHEESGQCNCRLGITGRDCSQCEPRHILTSRGCASCQDGCTDLLLDKVIELDLLFKEGSDHIVNGVIAPPWAPLLALDSNASVLEDTLQLWIDVDERMNGLPQQLEQELVSRAAYNTEQSVKQFGSSNDTSLGAAALYSQAQASLAQAHGNTSWARGLVAQLRGYVAEDAGLVNVGGALGDARQLLRFIQESDLAASQRFANKTFDECTDILYHVKDKMTNRLTTEHIHNSIDILLERIRDMNSKIVAILQSNTNSRRLTESNRVVYTGLEGRVRQIDKMAEEVVNAANRSENLNQAASVFLDEAEDDFVELEELSSELLNLSSSVEDREGILFNLNPQYRDRFVEPAVRHAARLSAEAQRYAGLFNATRRDADIAVKASRAYQTIVDVLEGARRGALDASTAAGEAYEQARSDTDSLVDQSTSAEEKSRVLKTISESQLMKVTELQLQLNSQRSNVHNMTSVLRGISKELASVDKSAQDMLMSSGANVTSKMAGLNQLAYKYLDTSDKLFEEAAMLREHAQTELRPQLKLLSLEGAKNLNLANEKITEALLTSKRVQETFYSLKSAATRYTEVFTQWNQSTGAGLAALRAKIQEARHLADGIRLSLTSKKDSGTCVRSYQPPKLEPTTRNDITLSYAISSQHRDALLFYLPSKSTEDFLAVEMINRKIRFVWNLGGDPGEVTHPMHIQTAGDLANDQHWYRIEAQRISNVGYLLVRPVVLPLGSPLLTALPISNSSSPGVARLDLGPSDRAWVGGAENRPPQLLSRQPGLVGCLHQVALDGRPLGLWNFRSQSESCTVCIEGAEENGQDELAYKFSGDGYALLHHESISTYNKYLFSVSLSFRTFDEDALLLLAIGHQQDKFVSLVLRQGHVVFRVSYGEDSSLEIATTGRYNTGNWTRLEATRYFDRKKKIERGILKVEGESRDGAPTPPPSQDDIPDLLRAQYYLGGVSPSFSSPLSLPPSFLGCMANINVAQEGYSPTRGQYWGVQVGCSNKPLSVVGFGGDGYLELPSHTLKKKATFGFMFATHQEDALLMLSTLEGFGTYGDTSEENEEYTNAIDFESRQSYYSVSLRRGQLDVRVNAGRGEARLASDSSEYNDAAFHSVLVTKHGRRLELRVDDVVHALATLPEGSSIVRAPGHWGGLFFGGLPQGINTTGRAVSDVPLVGTIKDAIFNDELLHFDAPIEFEHVLIGRPGLLAPPSGADSSLEASPFTVRDDLTGCHKGSSYSLEAGAVKFGDKKHSHVQVSYRKRNMFQKAFTIELTFRSFYNNGLLFIVPGNKGKQSHYLMTSLRNGRLSVVLKTRGKVEVMSQAVLNDGQWHTVRIEKGEKELSVNVDAILAGTSKAPRRLSIGHVMYVGGLPEQTMDFPELVVQKSETLKGCVQKLSVNGHAEDLVGESALHHNVGQCFPSVERGSYFPGDAYVVYKNQFNIGDLRDLEIEFRTSELTGILLSVSEPEGYPALSIELNQGKVILAGDMGDRRTFLIEHSFSSKYSGCDNRWHHIHLQIIKDQIVLRVDTMDHKYFLSDNGHFTSTRTSSPLYIGGLPDGAAVGTLDTRENFKGCIRNLVIGGEKLDWTAITYIHNILLSSCPVV